LKNLSGLIETKNFHVPKNLKVSVTSNLDVYAKAIKIDGTLIAKKAKEFEDGVHIRLTAENLIINGKIIAGSGSNGQKDGFAAKQEISAGVRASNGGSIMINGHTVHIGKTAQIKSGDGGNGGAARARGYSGKAGERGGNSVAVGGRGGDGGNITIDSLNPITVEDKKNKFYLGNGGNGGSANAVGGNGGAVLKKISNAGGVYSSGGDGGSSGVMNEKTLYSIMIINNKGKDVTTPLKLKSLFSGGRGGNGGKTLGRVGKNGKLISSGRKKK